MKIAGCDYIIYGVESGNDQVLKRMNKRTTVNQNRIAIRLTWEAGIYPDTAIMFGYCDETLEEIKNTVDLMIEENILPESLAVTTPMPGTVMYRELVAKGLIKDEVKYVENLINNISSISGQTKPLLNPTKISEDDYWPILLAEKRRLYTEHFLKNRALLSSFECLDESVCLHLECPYCRGKFNIDISLNNPNISKLFCKHCLHYIWVDPFLIPELKEHFVKVEQFIRGVENKKMSLVLYTDVFASYDRALFGVDPWNSIWRNVTSIVSHRTDFYYFKVISPKHARKEASAAVLITGMDPGNSIRKQLMGQGFSGNDIMTLFPTLPVRNFRQLIRQLLLRLSNYYIFRKLYRSLPINSTYISVLMKAVRKFIQ